MTQITNKKELLAALGPWIPTQFGRDGEPRSSTIFMDLDSSRAEEITKDLIENLREEFNRHPPVDLSPQDFIRIAARNIDLNIEVERYHFMWQAGIMWETIINRIEASKPKLPPSIGEN